MRTRLVLATVYLLMLFPGALHAQGSSRAQIVQAHQLWTAGQPKAALAILEPLLHQKPTLTAQELGVAWDLLGSSYQDLDFFDRSRSAYERSIAILRPLPEGRAQFASALNNLASLEQSMGRRKQAIGHCEEAIGIFQQLGDHVGATVTLTNLAVAAYTLKDYSRAQDFLQRAQHEAQQTTALQEDDVAALYGMRSVLALQDGRPADALWAIQQAIDRWIKAHGPDYLMLGAGYVLRGRALAGEGQYSLALADLRHALTITQGVTGKSSRAYVSAESAYAQILEASGEKKQASDVKREVGRLQSGLHEEKCSGCTIGIEAFR